MYALSWHWNTVWKALTILIDRRTSLDTHSGLMGWVHLRYVRIRRGQTDPQKVAGTRPWYELDRSYTGQRPAFTLGLGSNTVWRELISLHLDWSLWVSYPHCTDATLCPPFGPFHRLERVVVLKSRVIRGKLYLFSTLPLRKKLHCLVFV